ncbi:MAG: transposase [Anaeromyxobacter sp.]|nr:transposase [Anaeromyxobacter sp.]
MKILKAGWRWSVSGKPQQNGRHERFHLTLKQETVQPPAEDMQAQQDRFDLFQREYNDERPHEALRQRPPSKIYTRSKRACPSRLAVRSTGWYSTVTLKIGGNAPPRDDLLHQHCRGRTGRHRRGRRRLLRLYFFSRLLGRIHTAHPELGFIAA